MVPNDEATASQRAESSDEERIEKLVALTVGAAKGIMPAGQVSLVLMQIVNGQAAPPEIRAFCRLLQQIVRGDRAVETDHLPDYLARMIDEVLAQIDAPLPEAAAAAPEAEGLTLLELLERVGEACSGNIVLWQQLWNFTESLETSPASPAEIKTLAVVLRKILAGERQDHVSAGLPPDLAGPVNQLLGQLRYYAAQATPDHPSSEAAADAGDTP